MLTRRQLIFLDIDGVLRTWPGNEDAPMHALPWKVPSYNPTTVAVLNSLLRRTMATLVITSTWRDLGRRKLQQILNAWGVEGAISSMLAPERHDLDPHNPRWLQEERTHQLTAWLRTYLQRHPLERIRYVVFDDDLIGVPVQEPRCRGRFFRTRIGEGLIMPFAQQAETFLWADPWTPRLPVVPDRTLDHQCKPPLARP